MRPGSSLPQRAALLLRVAVSVLALWFLFALYPPGEVFRLLTAVGPIWFGVAICLYGASLCVATRKWWILLSVRPGLLFRAILAGCFYSLLPSGLVGGELSKVLIVRSHARDSLNVLASVMFDKLTGVVALVTLCAAALAFSDGRAQAIQFYAIAALAAACGLFMVFSSYAARLLVKLHPAYPAIRHALHFVLNTLHSIDRYRRNGALLARSLSLGLLNQCVLVSMYLVLAHGLGIQIGIANLVAAVSLANLATLLPISVGGFGVREAGLTALLTMSYGVPGEKALALSLSALGVSICAALAGGLSELRSISRRTLS